MEIKRFYADANCFAGDTVTIDGEEFLHLTKALRYKPGYKVIVNNNVDGMDYYCVIESIGKSAVCRIEEIVNNECMTAREISLYQALPKGDKIDLIVQKAVELGVGRIIPFTGEFVAETRFNKARLERIAKEACKQCGRSRLPYIGDLISFEEAVADASGSFAVMPYEREKELNFRNTEENMRKAERISVFVGSEGGFSEREADFAKGNGITMVSLGSRIMRCETAAIVSVALAAYQTGELER